MLLGLVLLVALDNYSLGGNDSGQVTFSFAKSVTSSFQRDIAFTSLRVSCVCIMISELD